MRQLAIVTSPAAGWLTMRKRWEAAFAQRRPIVVHQENYFSRLWFEDKLPASLRESLALRLAVQEATRQGADDFLLTTSQATGLLPIQPNKRYFVYGDATTACLARMYAGREPGAVGRWLFGRMRRYPVQQVYFLCMSEWYRSALIGDLDLGEQAQRHVVHLPAYVDTDFWTPAPAPRADTKFRVLFLGGDLDRKGIDVLLALATLPQNQNCEFHVVSPNGSFPQHNIVHHRNMRGDMPELVACVQQCDVLLLPTKADCSPLAILEAAACELPCIATAIGGVGELVQDGETGQLVPLRDAALFAQALDRYRSNRAMCAGQGKQARQRVLAHFSKPVNQRTLQALLDAPLAA